MGNDRKNDFSKGFFLRGVKQMSDMTQIDVDLPDDLHAWVEAKIANGTYASMSDYACDLIQRDIKAEDVRQRLQAAVDSGRSSGISDRAVEQILEDTKDFDLAEERMKGFRVGDAIPLADVKTALGQTPDTDRD